MEKKRAEPGAPNGVWWHHAESSRGDRGCVTIVTPHCGEVNGKRYTTKYICASLPEAP
jgi:hypothetical protein